MRLIHKIYAKLCGYFWAPCPMCGEMFGGHEVSDAFIRISYCRGKMVCTNCKEDAKAHNKKWEKDYLDAELEKWSFDDTYNLNVIIEYRSNLKR